MSNSIEERVVSMKFNNAQFEAGVKATITSLDGLKKSLDFSGGIKALGDLDKAGKNVNIKFDNKGFTDSVSSTISAADKVKSSLKFDSTVKSLQDLDNAGKKVNLKLDTATFQAGAKTIVDAANTIKQNLTFDSVQKNFGLLKSSAQNITFSSVIEGAKNVGKSLADMDLAGKAVSFLPIEDGAARAQQSIGAMSVAGIAALATLASKAVTVGLEMGRSLLIDPAKSGLAEYETNLGSIQTIMSNTQWENKGLGDVNNALDELNTYSDKTIYNFSEMASNIGTFTSAGVGLDDSVKSIKGIANLAAISGSNSQQASTAMYQLSQAMSSGAVKLQDWNSVVNAGMGGKVFQDALKETARNQGKNVDGLISQYGSFRESLQSGWLTDKVLNETLSKMTGDLTDDQLRAMGYNDEQIVGIQKMAKNAQDAATKIKTFSQLTGTLQEQTGSGWSQTWKLILGDFEQAKSMWTNVFNAIGPLMQKSADERNKMLGDWNQLGGRDVMISAVTNAFHALLGILQPVGAAFRAVFPPTTGKQLYDITVAVNKFFAFLVPGQQTVNLIGNSFLLFFTIIKIGVDIIKGAFSVVFAFFKAFATGGDSVKGSMQPVIDGLKSVADQIKNSTFITEMFATLTKLATALGTALGKVIPYLVRIGAALYQFGYDISGYAMHYVSVFARFLAGEFVTALSNGIDVVVGILDAVTKFVEKLPGIAKAFAKGGIQAGIDAWKNAVQSFGDGFDIVMTRVTARLDSFRRLGDMVAKMWDQISFEARKFWSKIEPIRTAVAKLFTDLGQELKNAFTDVNFNDTLDMVNTGLLAGLFLIFRNLFKKILGMGDGVKDGLLKNLSTSVESINGVLEALSGTLEAMQQNLKADTLMKIAIAIGILAISVVALSLVDSGALTKGLIAIGVMVVILSQAMKALDKISVGSGFLKIPFIAASMILLAIALGMLVLPVVILSMLSWQELLKGLLGVSVLLLVLSKATESMAKNPANLIATGVGLMAIAIAVTILAKAVGEMGKLDFGTLIKGLGGVSVVLFALVKTVQAMGSNPANLVATGISLIAIATGVKILASAVGDFGKMNTGEVIQGLISLGIVLALLQRFTNVVNPKDVVQSAVSMVILGAALKIIASAIKDFAGMSWEELAKGLLTMMLALNSMSGALSRVPPNMLTSAIGFVAVAVALKILASALKDMATMSWEEIAKSFVVLASSLIVLSVALIAMSGTILGAAALTAAAIALAILVPPLIALSGLSWDQLLVGLAALAGVFVLFGLAGLLLAPVAPIILALGQAMALFGLGLMAVGIGTSIFVAGLIVLTAAAIALGPAIVIVVGSILQLIPVALAELGKGIVAFADVIANAMPTFLNAFVALITTLLNAINLVFPQIMSTLWMLIVGLVDLIVRAVPLFVDAGMKIIVGILQGIGNNMGNLINAAVKVVTEFIDGIARNIGQVIESGANLIVKFVEGLAQSVRNNSDRMSTAGLDLAQAIIEGMANGIAKGVGRVVQAAKDMAGQALQAAKDFLGIHSPSREFFALGMYTDMGYANGVDKYAHLGERAAENMGKSAMATLQDTMSGLGDIATTNMDMAPTIRPVLDLSAIKRDGSLVAGMLSTPTLDVSASYDKASSLSASDAARRDAANNVTTTSETQSASGNVYNFTQNNTSPKSLSAAELYRQTRNQISVVKKGVLQNA